jgi:hypothetical protein
MYCRPIFMLLAPAVVGIELLFDSPTLDNIGPFRGVPEALED